MLFIKHLSYELTLIEIIEVLSHFVEIVVKVDVIFLFRNLINKVKNWFVGIMVVLVKHCFFKLDEVYLSVEKSEF